MDSAVQRKNMVDSQVRPNDVTDRRIPRAMLDIPREAFVPPERQAVAYMDGDLELPGTGRPARALLAPRTFAKLLQALDLESDAVVLEIGCATGYGTAILASMAKRVVGLESDAALAEQAKSALAKLGLNNAEIAIGPLPEGVPARGPFDAIMIGGEVSEIPAGLLDQLKDGGRLVAVLDRGGVGKATQWRRYGMQFDQRALFDAEARPLPGFERKQEFVL